MNISEHIKGLGDSLKQAMNSRHNLGEQGGDVAAEAAVSSSSNSMIQALIGPIDDVAETYFPPDLIGGTCPRIAGREEEIVWNAAAEACDSERVHVVWQSAGNRIWYLAIRSADLASHVNTWCPLAALLPTESNLESLPICYTYYGEDMAVLMVVAAEELHVFRGSSSVVRAKAERTARELGEASVINVDPFRLGQLAPTPWYSASLFEDRARRVLATTSVLASLFIIGISFLVWVLASMAMISARHNLADALDRTQTKSMQLVREAEHLRLSPMRDQIEKFLVVNDGLLSLNGMLNVYEIRDRTPRWRAVVPASATADRISAIGGKNIEASDQGVVIGNDAEIAFERESK